VTVGSGFNPNTVNQVEIFPDADVEYYQVSTPTDVNLITANGDATAYYAGATLADYVGNKITFFDTAGKAAVAYGYAADDAETTVELISNGDNEVAVATLVSESLYRCTSSHSSTVALSGSYSNLLQATQDTASMNRKLLDAAGSIITAGDLFDFSASAYLPSGQGITTHKLRMYESGVYAMDSTESSVTDAWVEHTISKKTSTGLPEFWLYGITGILNGDVLYWDDVSIKKYTALGTTALQLRSTGSTRNFTSIESGFNPNTVRLIKIG
jgi:hypothetical protein